MDNLEIAVGKLDLPQDAFRAARVDRLLRSEKVRETEWIFDSMMSVRMKVSADVT